VLGKEMSDATLSAEEEEIEREINLIDNEIEILQSRRDFLCHQKNILRQHRSECHQLISLEDDDEDEKGREREENETDEILSTKIQNILTDVFHFPGLRPGQYDLIKYSYLKYDIFGVMKTSGGKSLCYQLLPFLFDQSCFILVISPLIALIYDQVNYMNKILPGSAVALAGTMDRSHSYDIYREMDRIGSSGSQSDEGKSKRNSNPLKLIYATPEKIINSKLLVSHLQKAFDRNALARIVIDEAHCASQWGHDFRTDYSKLHLLRTVFPTVPMMLLTATANLTVRKDVIQMMRLGTPSSKSMKQCQDSSSQPSAPSIIRGLKVFVSDFDRPNLQFDVMRKPSNFSDCLDMVIALIMETMPQLDSQTRGGVVDRKRSSGHVIIYCFSQKDCEKVATGLSERGYIASPYHAGLDERLRQQIQENWMNGSHPHQIICATIAFGLGINVPTVRLVLHFTISKSLELYYQEVHSPFPFSSSFC
jgi:ATP-dependent DNA helicase Q1